MNGLDKIIVAYDTDAFDAILDACDVRIVSRLVRGRRLFGFELWHGDDNISAGPIDHDDPVTALGDGLITMEFYAEEKVGAC